jgi:hypothetical protein
MRDPVLTILLCIGVADWIRCLFDPPSSNDISELGANLTNRSTILAYLGFSVILVLLSVIGLIGMFVQPTIFRWVFLASCIGMITGTWFLPIRRNKPRRDIFLEEISRVVQGGILALAFL